MKNVNIEVLKQVAKSNSTAEGMFLVWDQRERARRSTELRRFKKHLRAHRLDVNDDDYERVFDKLASAGVGTIERNKRGRIGRFHWNYTMKSIAEAAMGKVEGIKTFGPIKERIPRLSAAPAVAAAAPTPGLRTTRPAQAPRTTGDKVAVYVIRNNRTIVLNMEEEEAKKFASLMSEQAS